MTFENSYTGLPTRFYARVNPARVPAPQLLAWNEELAGELGLSALAERENQLAEIFSGNALPDCAEPIAMAYAGHQFAQFVPQLGDGRAVLLGEVIGNDKKRYDIQLKGSGRTPFSRSGDGKSTIGPVIREYVVSEAMYSLGVRTTRALAAVRTGEQVYREEKLPGAVFTRVASSHIRVGTFQYFAVRGDVEGLKALADYAIERHYPELTSEEKPYLAFFSSVLEAQALLVAQWMDIGFIHGVMNTDNFTVSGETLDYGPCAFMDEYHANKVFSAIDNGGRYAYSNQAPVAQWNLARLAECLLLLEDDKPLFEEELARFQEVFEQHYLSRMRKKLGLTTDDADDPSLIADWLQNLQTNVLDYTLSFRQLSARIYAEKGSPAFGDFELRWKKRVQNQPQDSVSTKSLMDSVNPLFIPRNHQVEKAIQAAFDGDLSVFHELVHVLRNPFRVQPELAHYAEPPNPDERVRTTFCGT